MDQRQMQMYLEEGAKLSSEELLHFIMREKDKYRDNSAMQTFFSAEHAFYAGHYEEALKEYIQAKTIPFFQFFCYRVSAFIAQKRGYMDQALRFARKANVLQPEDQIAYGLLQTLLKLSEPSMEISGEIPAEFEAENVTSRLLQDVALPMSSPLSNSGVPPSSATLTRRSYGLSLDELSAPLLQPSTQETIMSIAETEIEKTSNHALDSLSSTEHALELRIQAFQKQRAQCLSQYIKRARINRQPLDNCLYAFSGWENRPEMFHTPLKQEESILTNFLLSNSFHRPTGGFFLKWCGKGIVVNPGKHFLDQFHNAGLYLTDIDIVIVTQTEHDSYADIKEIYELNYQLNKVNSELQIIHYYLNHKAYLELSHILKPNFKQERNAIHSLEHFVDSSDVEKIELTPEITLNYFPTSPKESLSLNHGSSLGIRFDLKTPLHTHEGRRQLKLGYLSGSAWSPLLGHHLGTCDILLTGFGHTQMNDFSKLNYNETCLGYMGTYSLMEEVKPRLLLCCEFDGREGDVRLEVGKKLRQELSHSGSYENTTIILPADNGLYLDLKNLQIRCSVSQEMVDPAQIRVVKSGEAFSTLLYLAPSCLLE